MSKKGVHNLAACVSCLSFRFLRRRHKYLQEKQSFETETQSVQIQNSYIQNKLSPKEKKYNVNEAVRSSHTKVLDTKLISVMKLE